MSNTDATKNRGLPQVFISGDTPYPGIQSREVPGKVKKGYKMKKPEYCDDT
jgi:hypothetical protein